MLQLPFASKSMAGSDLQVCAVAGSEAVWVNYCERGKHLTDKEPSGIAREPIRVRIFDGVCRAGSASTGYPASKTPCGIGALSPLTPPAS